MIIEQILNFEYSGKPFINIKAGYQHEGVVYYKLNQKTRVILGQEEPHLELLVSNTPLENITLERKVVKLHARQHKLYLLELLSKKDISRKIEVTYYNDQVVEKFREVC